MNNRVFVVTGATNTRTWLIAAYDNEGAALEHTRNAIAEAHGYKDNGSGELVKVENPEDGDLLQWDPWRKINDSAGVGTGYTFTELSLLSGVDEVLDALRADRTEQSFVHEGKSHVEIARGEVVDVVELAGL